MKNREGLVRMMAGYAGGSALAKAIPALLLPVYGRFLAPAEFGIVATCTAVFALLTTLCTGGVHGALTRMHFDATDPVHQQRLNAAFLITWAAVATPVVLVALVLTVVVPDGWLFRSIPNVPFLLATVLAAPGAAAVLVLLAQYRVRESVTGFVAAQLGSELVRAIAIVIAVAGLALGAVGQVWAVTIASTAFGVWAVVSMVRFGLRQPGRQLVIETLTLGWPLVLHGAAGWMLTRGNRVVLERFVSLEELGVYSMAAMLAQLVGVLTLAINQAWTPRYFRVLRDGGNAVPELRWFSIFIVGIVGIAALGLMGVGRELLSVIGRSEYAGAFPFLAPIVVGQVIQTWYYVRVNEIFWMKRNDLIPMITGGAALMNLGTTLALIPVLGAMGAAYGSLAGAVAAALLADRAAGRVSPAPIRSKRAAWIGSIAIVGIFVIGSFPLGLAGRIGVVVSAAGLIGAVLTTTRASRASFDSDMKEKGGTSH